MLQGMLDTLTDFDDKQNQVLLDNYVFKIMPCLNPDGVVRGEWRFDTQGVNLNRQYLDPSPEQHPSIYAAKKTILKEYETNEVKMLVDLHAHST